MRIIMEKEKCCINGTTEFGKLEELSEYLKVIADSTRLQILCLLKKGERCVCNIHEPLGLPQNLTSHHLKALRDAEMVLTRREGRWIYYSINSEKISYLASLYKEVLLGGLNGNQSIGAGLCELQEACSEC
jgi:ArsR family transcriptional regulator, arsenate/arsenite/antimonite-responsive transcriptional repressor